MKSSFTKGPAKLSPKPFRTLGFNFAASVCKSICLICTNNRLKGRLQSTFELFISNFQIKTDPLPVVLLHRYIRQFVGYKEKSSTFAVVYKIQITL